MNALVDTVQRRRQNLNPLTTQLNPAHVHQYQAPMSAVGLSSPFHQQTPYTPVSAVRQYNPQQWTGGPSGYPTDNGGGRYSPAAGDAIEAPAPPPYSPPRSNGPVTTFSPQEPSSSVSPMTRPSPGAYRHSPEPTATVFPPPPPSSRTRSRDRTQPLLNHLGNVFHRKPPAPEASDSAVSRVSSDMNREHASSSRRPAPLTIEPTRAEEFPTFGAEQRPPASRRAASTGAIGAPFSSHSRGSSTTRWEPGMPLPPPPPGPPPQSSSRSQSLTRDPSRDPVVSPPTRRPQPISILGPVPPTPADWVDSPGMAPNARAKSPMPGLHIDTSSITSSGAGDSNSGSSSSGLTRAHAVRGEPKSIRERRSESRTGKAIAVEERSNNPWAESITPSDIVVPPMTVLGRRPTITKSTPRSGRSLHHQDTPNSARTLNQNTPRLSEPQQPESRGSTPRPLNSAHRPEAPTPPFSPDHYTPSHHTPSYQNHNQNIPPKSLPTPPPMNRRRTDSSPRPISHILHTPLKDQGMPTPLSPMRATSRQSGTTQSPASESFSRAAHQRHEIFVQKEASASNDEERIRLFAEFIVSESRIRRDRYASAIDAMGSELLELTRDLFRPYSDSQRNPANSYASMKGDRRSTRNLPTLQTGPHSDSTPSSASGMASPAPGGRPESTWWTGYMPSLSPIPSMTASQAPDESSSRGRPSSRWWEVGQSGSGGSPTVLERSKRESKYMGMPRELRESLQWEGNGNSTPSQTSSRAGPSTQTSYGPNEYPPEKVGWHEEGPISPPHQTPTMHLSYSPAPVTPNPRHLDVSRLVTLPPPYPRHHPAVNNNHPDLTAIRTSVRSLSDFSEIEKIKEQFTTDDAQIHHTAKTQTVQRRQALRSNIQREIEAGSMSYADAAKAEADFALTETESTKAASKASFELFQTAVVAPVNDLLMARVTHATSLFEQLRSQLFVDAHTQDPTATQEEGDEQPELLEKLTLLKWIFEARETLHMELYELLSERNDRYRDVVIEPYRLAGRAEKIEGAERFFADDALKRRLEFEQGGLQRAGEFMDVVESNVLRGVEVQLSAFWDIAPGLKGILEKIPREVGREFRVQIPADEYAENPGYHEWPMQYLYSLLEHGGRSTYQFIESQTNLLCLLHEVKTAVVASKVRVAQAERVKEGEEREAVRVQTEAEREEEEKRLTDDLKDKVRCVEEQWESALGDDLQQVKERVREFLEREGGWEGMEDAA